MEGNDNEDADISTEELVQNNNIIMNVLIDMLIEKKVISEEELKKRLDKAEEEMIDTKENAIDKEFEGLEELDLSEEDLEPEDENGEQEF